MKAYTPYNRERPITPEDKSRRTSFHATLIECSAEIELIVNIINTLRIQFLSLLDIVSNTNCDEYNILIDQRHLYLALYFIGYSVEWEELIKM